MQILQGASELVMTRCESENELSARPRSREYHDNVSLSVSWLIRALQVDLLLVYINILNELMNDSLNEFRNDSSNEMDSLKD